MVEETRKPTGRVLNRAWGIGARHALYHEHGLWYHQLRQFPGALIDAHGYVLFETEATYRGSDFLRIGKDVWCPGGIAGTPQYVRHSSDEAAAGATFTSAILDVGRIYTRSDLADEFQIADATLNTGIFRPAGHHSVWLFVTEDKTADRVQYKDFLDGDILYWQGQTSGRKDRLIIEHRAQDIELLVFYRKSKNQFPHGGFVFEGLFAYQSHTGTKPTSFVLVRTAIPPLRDLDAEMNRLVLGRGQGFLWSQKARRAVELRAMEVAVEHFLSEGWSVTDVSSKRPYDIECVRGTQELRVEVKGTTTAGDSILLTRNEVTHARENVNRLALFILHGVEVAWEGDEPRASGGTAKLIQPWDIETGTLAPLSFEYRLV